MTSLKSLAFAAFAVATLAAAPALAEDCQVKHDNSCAHPGASCGPKREKGFCQTLRRRQWRGRDEISCGCHPRVFIH